MSPPGPRAHDEQTGEGEEEQWFTLAATDYTDTHTYVHVQKHRYNNAYPRTHVHTYSPCLHCAGQGGPCTACVAHTSGTQCARETAEREAGQYPLPSPMEEERGVWDEGVGEGE